MIILLATLYFLIPISSATLDLVKFIEHNIDPSVDPCDNFYRHTCAKDKPQNETVNSLLQQKFDEILKNLELPNKFKFPNDIVATESPSPIFEMLANVNQSENIQKIANDYLSSCVNKNVTTMKTILQKLGEQFETIKFENLMFDRNCERASKALYETLQNAWIKETKKSWNYINSTLANIQANDWYLKNSYFYEKHVAMLRNFRKELLKQIKITPWVESTNTELLLKIIAEQLEFKNCIESAKYDLEELLKTNTSLENCRTNSTIESLRVLCYLKESFGVVRNMRLVNAFNSHPKICFHNVLLSAVMNSDSPGIFYGSSGSVMAHEIGHTFVKSKRDMVFIPDFPKTFKTCVDDQFEKTCSTFVEKSCNTSDRQFDENGSDIFGNSLAFDVMMNTYGKKVLEVVPGSKYNFTNAEMFFYASSYVYCSRKDSECDESDPHHAPNARVNAAVVQSPHFQAIFKCDTESRMMKSKSEQCHLFGEHAKE